MCFEEMLETFNWSVDNDKEGNICGIYPDIKRLHDKDDFFSLITKYVKPDSHIRAMIFIGNGILIEIIVL